MEKGQIIYPWQEKIMALITDPSGVAIDTTKKYVTMMPRQQGKSMTAEQMYNAIQRLTRKQEEDEMGLFDDPMWCESRVLEQFIQNPKTTIYKIADDFEDTLRSLGDRGYVNVWNIHNVHDECIRFNAYMTHKGREYYDSLQAMNEL